MYDLKENEYFNNARTDIEKLIQFPANSKILEIGCGNGSTLIWMKKKSKCQHVTGIDAFASPGENHLIDCFIKYDLNKGLPETGEDHYDGILCLDVLEHLINPWEITKKLRSIISDEGQLIVSLPNIQNYRIVLSLFLKGDFNYQPEGILDKTHLRFFTKKTSIKMLEEAGFSVQEIISPDKMTPFKKLLSLFGLDEILAKQFIFSCKPSKMTCTNLTGSPPQN